MKNSRKNKKPGMSAKREERIDIAQLDRFAAKAARFHRRMTFTAANLATGAGGTIAATTLCNSASLSASAPDFSSCANLYTAYRVLAMEVHVLPYYPVNTTAVTVPAVIATCEFQAGLIPATYAQMADGSNTRLTSGYRAAKFAVDARGDPNAMLWTPTTSAIASTSSFGIAVVSGGLASTATTNVWFVQAYALVEFQTAG